MFDRQIASTVSHGGTLDRSGRLSGFVVSEAWFDEEDHRTPTKTQGSTGASSLGPQRTSLPSRGILKAADRADLGSWTYASLR